jgi:hypothetical protein
MAAHIALSRDWFGQRTSGGIVVYIAAEGQRGFRLRIEAFRRHHGVEDMPFALVPTQIDLLDPKADVERLIDAIAAAVEARGLPPVVLIMIDTISRTFGGGDENTSDMAAYVGNIGRIQAAFGGCAAMLVHHRPKDSNNDTPRGHGSLWGACDTIIMVEAGETKTARITKQKDVDAIGPFMFKLHQVEVGVDEDGEPVTSCVVEPVDGDVPTATPSGRPRKKLTPNQQIVLAQLGEALAAVGAAPPAVIPDHVIGPLVGKVVPLEEWRERAISAVGHDRDANRDDLRKTFNRCRDALQAAEYCGIWKEWAWLR